MTKRLLITGGSRGIGRATALLAGARGWSVAVNYVSNAEAAQSAAEEVRAAGGEAIVVKGDVAVEADVIAMFDEAEAAFGGLDCVIANAGIVGPKAAVADMTLERMQRVVRTNVVGALLTARETSKRLRRPMDAASASLVILSSAAARIGSPDQYVDYAASKGATDTMTLGLSKELAPLNIRVNAVRPGLIETDIHASGGEPDRAWRLGATVPMARPGTAKETAEAITWLCSDEASYVTGAILDVAGGR
ncbi:MAG: SDR family oxidoreductase [Pseudomonadota bacterium]